MNKSNALPTQPRTSRSLDYLRKRSQHRTWWNSARIALLRGRSGEVVHQPISHNTCKRV